VALDRQGKPRRRQIAGAAHRVVSLRSTTG